MASSNQLYTVGHWTVKPGKEKTFISEWNAFARWTSRTQLAARRGILLQDREYPQQFISLGPWENADAVKEWRESVEFKRFGVKVRELCEEFRPGSFDIVATSED